MSMQPFDVSVPQETLDDLRERLGRTRFPDEVSGAGWDYGANLAYLRELCDYWRDGFDWRVQEEIINAFAHFRAEIDGFGVHFIHERGKGSNPLPIILTHGWPDSFFRMLQLIPLLTDPEGHCGDPADSFDVVVPSLPGYGFSDRPTERGMTNPRVADLWQRPMTEKLGYERFAAHGSDIGSGVTHQLALDRPGPLVGIHLTDVPFLNLAGSVEDAPDLSESERSYMERGRTWGQEEAGYVAIQSTRPQTLAYGLNDSPAGLAAWIVETFRAWMDGDAARWPLRSDGRARAARRGRPCLLSSLALAFRGGSCPAAARARGAFGHRTRDLTLFARYGLDALDEYVQSGLETGVEVVTSTLFSQRPEDAAQRRDFLRRLCLEARHQLRTDVELPGRVRRLAQREPVDEVDQRVSGPHDHCGGEPRLLQRTVERLGAREHRIRDRGGVGDDLQREVGVRTYDTPVSAGIGAHALLPG
jgi:pimeloyl-ACP methyl ester carboxylesterase